MKFQGLLAGGVLALLCWCPAAAADPSSVSVKPYFFQTFGPESAQAEMGRLQVPERHENPTGKAIQLAFVRFKSLAAHPGPPLVYLGGGIGNGITSARTIRFRFFNAMRAVSDVIVLDQRGSGLSQPSLDCGQKFGFALDRAATPQNMFDGFAAAAAPCLRAARAAHLDLNAYNADESADDVESLRVALSVSKIDLLAISYGTTLALNVMKRHPQSVHRAVLAGVEGVDDTYKLPDALDRQFARIGAFVSKDTRLSQLVPDLPGLFARVLAQLNEHDRSVEITDPQTHERKTVTVGPFDLQYFTVYDMGDSYMFRRLPADLYKMSQGDYSALAEHAYAFRRQGLDSLLRLTLDCASGLSTERNATIEAHSKTTLLGPAVNFPFPQACAAIGNPDLGPAFRAPVISRVPTLFISGTLDGKTPPENAARVAAGFSAASQLVIDGAGHSDDLFSSSPRIRELVIAFFRGAKIPNQTVTLPPIDFLVP